MLRLPAQEATTRHLCSLYPFQAGDDLSDNGVLLGLDALSGAPVGFDPFCAYGRGLLTNPNGLVVGQVGRGKSTFAKTFLAREARLYGRPVYVVDPKGEYEVFARHLGLCFLRLAPGGTVRLNPLDPGPAGDGGEGLGRRRAQLLFALVASGLERGLLAEERAGLAAVAKVASSTATLSEVAAELLSPSEALAKTLATTASELKARCRETALELRRLVEADLSGMFDGPTTAELHGLEAGLVVDLSAVHNTPAQAPVLVCAGTWLQAALRARPRSILLLDEAWALCSDLGVAKWLQAMAKLARATGTSLWLVTHRLSDLLSAGAADPSPSAWPRGCSPTPRPGSCLPRRRARSNSPGASLGCPKRSSASSPAWGEARPCGESGAAPRS